MFIEALPRRPYSGHGHGLTHASWKAPRRARSGVRRTVSAGPRPLVRVRAGAEGVRAWGKAKRLPEVHLLRLALCVDDWDSGAVRSGLAAPVVNEESHGSANFVRKVRCG